MILLADLEYFPKVNYYKKAVNYSYVLIELYNYPEKGEFHNRMIIASGNGPLLLSIPLEGGRSQHRPLKEVRIANRYNWQDNHWKALTSCYNRSPWFGHYRDGLEGLYQTRFDYLSDWGLACMKWVQDSLGLKQELGTTNAYFQRYNPDEFEDYRRGSESVEEGLLTGNEQRRYPQVFEERTGFLPGLSVLDLLFCTGPEAVDFLRGMNN
jgi:hypothetical protein